MSVNRVITITIVVDPLISLLTGVPQANGTDRSEGKAADNSTDDFKTVLITGLIAGSVVRHCVIKKNTKGKSRC